MQDTRPPEALISEVGLRDGLQSVKATMPTADKFKWLDALHAAGLREIEVASFVPAKLLPQMANPAQVRRLFNKVRAAIGDKAGAAHMHNTRGLGLATCLAAYDVGVRTFDASRGGLPKGWKQA